LMTKFRHPKYANKFYHMQLTMDRYSCVKLEISFSQYTRVIWISIMRI